MWSRYFEKNIFIRTKRNYKERMKEVPIEKGTGQSDCEIAANCDKKKSSNYTKKRT